MERLPDRRIVGKELRSRFAIPLAPIGNGFSLAAARHGRVEVRQVVELPREEDGDRARRVEAEEPDSRLSARRDVRANVQLREAGRSRQRRQAAEPETSDL